jgi:hypothetical protein
MTENTELLIIGAIGGLIMLYLGWKIFTLIVQVITDQLKEGQNRPPASWNDRLRKRGPWDA